MTAQGSLTLRDVNVLHSFPTRLDIHSGQVSSWKCLAVSRSIVKSDSALNVALILLFTVTVTVTVIS